MPDVLTDVSQRSYHQIRAAATALYEALKWTEAVLSADIGETAYAPILDAARAALALAEGQPTRATGDLSATPPQSEV